MMTSSSIGDPLSLDLSEFNKDCVATFRMAVTGQVIELPAAPKTFAEAHCMVLGMLPDVKEIVLIDNDYIFRSGKQLEGEIEINVIIMQVQ